MKFQDREIRIKKPVPKQKRPTKTRHLIEDAIDDFGEDLVEITDQDFDNQPSVE